MNNKVHSPVGFKVAVVIPNWNGQDFLRPCLDSLLSQTIKADIIVVENGSIDKSDEILASYGKKIVVLKQAKNLGFAGGVNVGIKYAIDNDYEYIGLFNNDAVADRAWAKELVGVLEGDKNIGIATCKFLHIGDNKLDSTGDFYTIFGLPYPRGRNELDDGQYDNQNYVFGASGGASMYKADLFKEIGLFDEDFFAYYEDVDISFRAQLYGYKIYYNPKAKAYHHIGATSGKIKDFTVRQNAKNFWLTYSKNMPGYLFVKYLPFVTYWYLRMFAVRLIKGGFLAFAKGWLKSIALTPSTISKRHNIQKNKKVSAKYIDSIIDHKKAPKPPK